MKTDELRERYLDFFIGQGHRLCESDVLVPKWDKSVLFTPAGMNPFKGHFLGNVELEFTRATSCQKCLRTGDIENVGRTSYHHTFFEMLGNFSFGDYFKREAIGWAWEFLTDKKWLGIDADKLTVTVFLDDDEAAEIWEMDTGLTRDRIERMDEYENFWPAGAPTDGPDGVCGPCSEIFFHPNGIGKGNEVEIWNLVFTQFNRSGDPPDNLTPLPRKNIDTGMGLERIAATLQGVDTNFHIDILKPIVDAAAEITGQKYLPESNTGRFLRRITDHVRACTFCIHENVYPGSSKAEYVVRRLLRRCTLEGRQLGYQEPFLYRLVPAVIDSMSKPYPELAESSARIEDVIKNEEERFLNKLDDGLARIEKMFAAMAADESATVNGRDAAELYQTFGIPPELVEAQGRDQGYQFDWSEFEAAMEEFGVVSGKIADTVMDGSGPIEEIKREVKTTSFLGYETCASDATIVGLIDGDRRFPKLDADSSVPQIVVLDQTPFYAESGGQVGDQGTLSSDSGEFEVNDVQKDGSLFLHFGEISRGYLEQGQNVKAKVDQDRREGIRRAHTATHLLHYNLQQIVGSHAQQRGSKVAEDFLRFDFSNLKGLSDDELQQLELRTRSKIGESAEVRAEVLPLAEAKSRGAMMLFGEKYPDPVRMISIGEFSKELCGGTHLENSSEIGEFEIVVEEGVAAGTRRIEALTGKRAAGNRQQLMDVFESLRSLLQVEDSKVESAIENLQNEVKELKKRIASGNQNPVETTVVKGGEKYDYERMRNTMKEICRSFNVTNDSIVERVSGLISERDELRIQFEKLMAAEKIDADELIQSAIDCPVGKVIVAELPDSNPNLMRQLIDQIRKSIQPVAVMLITAVSDSKVILVAGVSRELVESGIRAGDWVKHVAPIVGGGGGGKPDMAQAGGKQPENIPAAIRTAAEFMEAQLADSI